MFGSQKARLNDALSEHQRALNEMQSVRGDFKQQRTSFFSKPVNLFIPFTAGVLLTASQLKNDPKGLNRLPLMNIAKMGVSTYALFNRMKSIQQQSPANENVPNSTHVTNNQHLNNSEHG